jgi:hypothetical protein
LQASQNSAIPEAQPISDSGSGDGNPADPGTGFPFTLVAALNLVLYQRQGYKHMARHGTPQYASLQHAVWRLCARLHTAEVESN